MGLQDRDYFYEDQKRRDALPHPTQRRHKKSELLQIADPYEGQRDITAGGFKSGFTWGAMFTSCIWLLVYMVIR